MSFVALSKVSYPAHLKDDIQSVGLQMIPVAREQPGFVSIAFHQSAQQNETMMYWEWESVAHHEACMQSADWSTFMQQFADLFSQEGVGFTLETYDRLG